MNENDLTAKIRLKAAQLGWYLWRNNVGATYTKNNDFIRYGLANDSKAINSRLKSSDLIGIKPMKITKEMVGKTLGVFVAREIKSSSWKYTGAPRENAQPKVIDLGDSVGGDARFITCEEQL